MDAAQSLRDRLSQICHCILSLLRARGVFTDALGTGASSQTSSRFASFHRCSCQDLRETLSRRSLRCIHSKKGKMAKLDYDKIFIKEACPTSIGGQAIMEGVMMQGPDRIAIAMRMPTGELYLRTKKKARDTKIMKVPFVRGIVAFARSLDVRKSSSRSVVSFSYPFFFFRLQKPK